MLAVTAFSPSGGATDAIVVASLTRLAKKIELVVVCDQNDAVGLVQRLRAGLPRHTVVTLLLTPDADGPAAAELALIQALLEDGALPITVVPTGTTRSIRDAAIQNLAHGLGADDVLAVNPIRVAAQPAETLVGPTDPTS